MDDFRVNIDIDPSEIEFYTVQKGDTLRKIADRYWGDPEYYKKIMELNGLINTMIYPGQILRIPVNNNSNIIFYRVKSGDTLWKISEKFLDHGYKYQDIMRDNKLTTDMIYPGQILRIKI